MQIPDNVTGKLGKVIGLLTLISGIILLVLPLIIPKTDFEPIRGITIGFGFVVGGIGCMLVLGTLERVSAHPRLLSVMINWGVAPLVFLLGVAYVFPFKIDDSYISMRYASNLAAGYGLVFNPGGPRIEGYTNLLLVLIEAALLRVGVQDIWAVKLLNTGCGLAVIAAITWYAWRLLEADRVQLHPLPAIVALLTASSSPFIIWTPSGMETTLFVFFVCVGIINYLLFLRGHLNRAKLLLIDLALVLATLTRPEGLLFWAVTTSHTLIIGSIHNKKLLSRARVIGILGGFVLLALYGLWKVVYFGQLLPATYLAKQAPLHFGTFARGGETVGLLSNQWELLLYRPIYYSWADSCYVTSDRTKKPHLVLGGLV
jgi:hypothetical protein